MLIGGCLWTVAPAAAETKYAQEADFARALQREFVEQVGDEEVDWECFGGQTSFAVEDASQIKIMISKSKFDELQNKFSATAEVFADGFFALFVSPVRGNAFFGDFMHFSGANLNFNPGVFRSDDTGVD